jgi:ABC-2 type transport system permease protein
MSPKLHAAGSLSPSPGPAPRPQAIWSQALWEIRSSLLNGEQLLLTLVIPVVVLVAMAHAPEAIIGSSPVIDVVTPGVLALAVMSTAFTGLAIATAFERRYGVLRLLGSTPLGRSGFLIAKTLGVLAVELIQFLLIALIARAMGWSPKGSYVITAGVLLIGTFTFAALGLLLAGTLRAEGTLAVANLIYLVLLGLGGVVVPASRFPSALSHLISALPSSALADGLRMSLMQAQVPWLDLLILSGWGLVAFVAVRRWFRWSP